MPTSLNASLNVSLNPQSLNASTKQVQQALGRITGQASEFQKSLDASTARVFAFGATTAVLNGVSQSFKALLSTTIEVEKRLIEINSIFQATASNFNKFRNSIFQVAKETGQSFNTVAEGAAELARQGLSAEETASRLKSALVLTRISGLDAEKSVKALTAAINGFQSAGLKHTEIVNKMVAVDTAFAVSAQDLAEAFSRAGSTAEDAGVSFDQLLGLVTAVEQRTARGGAVIGNAFKSIFTRLQRGTTINQLQDLGVAIDASQSGVQKLQALSTALENIGDPTVAAKIKELAGGVFQINVVSAALKDIGSDTSIFASAAKTASQATNEAFEKNKALSESLADQINRLVQGVTSLAQKIGTVTFAPLLENIVSLATKFTEFLDKALDPEKGSTFIKGFFKAISAFLSGPAIVIFTAAFAKIAKLIAKFAVDGIKSLFQMGTAAERIKQIEGGIVGLLQRDSNLRKAIENTTLTQAQREQAVIDAIRRENALLKSQAALMRQISTAAAARGVTGFSSNTGLFSGRRRRGFATGFQEEEATAQMLGATSNVNAHFGQGKINGRRFIMNDQEVEIPNFAGGNSAVIPMYASGSIPRYSTGRLSLAATTKLKNTNITSAADAQRQGFNANAIAAGIKSGQLKDDRKKAAAKKTPMETINMIDGTKAAMLVPNIGMSSMVSKGVTGSFRQGNKTIKYEIEKGFPIKGPQVPKAVDQAADPKDEQLKKNITESVTKNAAKFAALLNPALGNPEPKKIESILKKQGGGKGALRGVIGAAFEAAVNQGLEISPAQSKEGGDFDIKGGKKGSNVSAFAIEAIRSLFGLGKKSNKIFLDYKHDATGSSMFHQKGQKMSTGTVGSMAKKLINQGQSRVDRRKVKSGTPKKAGGFIPKFARGTGSGASSANASGQQLAGTFDKVGLSMMNFSFIIGGVQMALGQVTSISDKLIAKKEEEIQKTIESIKAGEEDSLTKSILLREQQKLIDNLKEQPTQLQRLASAANIAAIALASIATINMVTGGGAGRFLGSTGIGQRTKGFFAGDRTSGVGRVAAGIGNRSMRKGGTGMGSRFVQGIGKRAGGISKATRGAGAIGVGLAGVDIFNTLTNDSLSKREKSKGVGGAVGGAGGAIAGAAIGSAIMPVVGTIIGGVLGGLAGGAAGEGIGGLFGGKEPVKLSSSQVKDLILQSSGATGPAEAGFLTRNMAANQMGGGKAAALSKQSGESIDEIEGLIQQRDRLRERLGTGVGVKELSDKKRKELEEELSNTSKKLADEQKKLANITAQQAGHRFTDVKKERDFQNRLSAAQEEEVKSIQELSLIRGRVSQRFNEQNLALKTALSETTTFQRLVDAFAEGPNKTVMQNTASFQTDKVGLATAQSAAQQARANVQSVIATVQRDNRLGKVGFSEGFDIIKEARNKADSAQATFDDAARKFGFNLLKTQKEISTLQLDTQTKIADMLSSSISASANAIKTAFGGGPNAKVNLDVIESQRNQLTKLLTSVDLVSGQGDPELLDRIGRVLEETMTSLEGTGVDIETLLSGELGKGLGDISAAQLEEILTAVANRRVTGGTEAFRGDFLRESNQALGIDASGKEMDELGKTQRALNQAMIDATNRFTEFARDEETAAIAAKLKEQQEAIEAGNANIGKIEDAISDLLPTAQGMGDMLKQTAKFTANSVRTMKQLAREQVKLRKKVARISGEQGDVEDTATEANAEEDIGNIGS